MRTAHIACVGCMEARLECAQLQRFLELNGFSIDGPEQSDLVILYSCGLTQQDAQISLEIMKELRNQVRHNSTFIVWGCLPMIDPKLILENYSGTSFGRREILRLEELIDAKVKYEDAPANHLFPENENIKRIRSKYQIDPVSYFFEELNYQIRSRTASVTDPSIFQIMVARGCLSGCAYCSDLHSCGRLESKPIERVIMEFKRGLKEGFTKFHLVATDLGSYGRDLGSDLSNLLEKMISEDANYQLILPNVNPRFLQEMNDDLEPIFGSGKIGILSVPVESGSDRILKMMGRGYSIERFKQCINNISRKFPKIVLWTQLLVGFPGETEGDFEATVRLLDETFFDYIQVFKFSGRPMTRASYFVDQISESTILDRYRRLLAKAIYRELYQQINRNGRTVS